MALQRLMFCSNMILLVSDVNCVERSLSEDGVGMTMLNAVGGEVIEPEVGGEVIEPEG